MAEALSFGYSKKEKIICISFLACLSLAFLLITPWGTDIEFHVLRIAELAGEFTRTGRIPVYMYTDVYAHYGYPLPVFYCPVFLFPFSLIVLLGVSYVWAYKLLITAVLWAVFATSYFCLKRLFPNGDFCFAGGFLFAVQPFFLIELYVRASVASAMVFVFIPLVLLGFYEIMYDRDERAGTVFLAVGMSGIVMSHVTSTVIVTCALAVMFIIRIITAQNRLRKLLNVICAALICAGLTAWYLLPMLEQFAHATFRGSNVSVLQIPKENLFALLLPMHLSIALSALLNTNVPYSMIGGSIVPVIALLIWLFIKKRELISDRRIKTLFICYFAFVPVLLFRWTFIERYIAFIQFAWRIFMIASVIGTALMILVYKRSDTGKDRRFVIITAVISAVYVLMFFFGYHAVRNLMPGLTGEIIGHDPKAYSYESETPDDLYIPVNVDKNALYEKERTVTASSGRSDFTFETDTAAGCVYIDIADTYEDTVFTCPFIMYPGYGATDENGNAYEVRASSDGMTDVYVPAGTKGRICVRYTGTAIQRISFIVSVTVLCVLIIAAACAYFLQRNKKKDI